MFNSQKTEATAEKVSYNVKVESAKTTKNASIVMLNLDVNGVKINSVILKEVAVKADGKTHKKGDICYILDMPQEKVGDKYYKRVWFPVSNETLNSIVEQVKALL